MMRTLQAGVGNAVISRHWQRTRTRAILARYEAGEHALLGGPGKTLKIGGVDVTEGELAAMGDFYKDPQSMETDVAAAKPKFETLLADIRTDREHRAAGKEGIAESVWVSDTAHRPEHERYLDLAGENFAHFAPGKSPGPNHKTEWERLHRQALDLAHATAAGNQAVPDEARVVNAFAAHFLQDAFAAGHLANKRELMNIAATKFDALKTSGAVYKENSFSKAVARGLLADAKVSAEFAKRELKLPFRAWAPFGQENTSVLIFGLRSKQPDKFLSLFARTVHDQLDDAIRKGPDKGLEVTNDNGDVWTLAGDETLNLSPTTQKIAGQAVDAARDNLATAAATSGALDYAALFKNVWRFAPRPTDDAQHAAAVAAKKKADEPKPAEGAKLKSPRWGTPEPDALLQSCFADTDRLRPRDPDQDAVKLVQQALVDVEPITGKHYDLGPDGVDGRFGPMTAAAVKKFKSDEALGSAQYPDVGPGTMRRLDDLFTGAAPKPATPVLQPGSRPGWQQMNAAVDTYTDPSQQDLIDAIIKLASNKLDALIAELEALGYARLKKK
jgi:peptidoglycan hydrolase-like protein with peptidoglycan-binding domain